MPSDEPKSALPPFHLALPVADLASARSFYGDRLGCREGRSAPTWVDFDFFGHQLVCHVAPGAGSAAHNPVEGDAVPIPHFGVVLALEDWRALGDQLRAAGMPFEIAPRIRFAGQIGEQGTFFVRDPFGNVLEFKGFRDRSRLFAHAEPPGGEV